MANIKQVAARAELSVACVSKYLKNPGSVLPASREQIEKAIAELAYSPSKMAQSLRTKRTYTVKAIMESITNPFFAEIFENLRRSLESRGYTTILQTTDVPRFKPQDFHSVDGVLFCFPEDEGIIREAAQCSGGQLPMVCMNWRVPDPPLPTVLLDVKQGIIQAAQCLLDRDCRRLAYVGGPRDSAISIEKQKGFFQMAEKATGEYFPVFHGDFTFQSGYQAAEHLLKREERPDGIVCENDILAAGVLRCLSEHGVAVPDEMQVTGFDNIPLAEMLIPSLSSAAIPTQSMCKTACEMLLAAIEKKPTENCRFHTSLIVRQSCR